MEQQIRVVAQVVTQVQFLHNQGFTLAQLRLMVDRVL
jgi:hypothetical protein